MTASFECFCLASGIEALAEMMESDAAPSCGPRHARDKTRKARNILDRLPKSMHASVRRVLRQAWEINDADKAER